MSPVVFGVNKYCQMCHIHAVTTPFTSFGLDCECQHEIGTFARTESAPQLHVISLITLAVFNSLLLLSGEFIYRRTICLLNGSNPTFFDRDMTEPSYSQSTIRGEQSKMTIRFQNNGRCHFWAFLLNSGDFGGMERAVVCQVWTFGRREWQLFPRKSGTIVVPTFGYDPHLWIRCLICNVY